MKYLLLLLLSACSVKHYGQVDVVVGIDFDAIESYCAEAYPTNREEQLDCEQSIIDFLKGVVK